MSIAPNPKSPLEVAREFSAKAPDALPPGKYLVVDRVDPREPSTHHLTDAGTDRLLARTGAVKDAVEVSNEAWAANAAAEFIANSGVLGRELDTKFLALAFERAILRGHIQGASSALDKMTAAIEKPAATTPTDLGDGLGLPLVSVGPGPIGSATQTEIPAAKPTCRTCGRTTLGADECGYCKYDRHNDDDAQRAAQERADAEDATT